MILIKLFTILKAALYRTFIYFQEVFLEISNNQIDIGVHEL